MKFIFAFLTASVCLLTGLYKGSELSGKVRELENVIAFLNRCKSEIKYRESRVLDIINDFSKTDGRRLEFIDRCLVYSLEMDFPKAWKKAVGEACGRLSQKDRENLCFFGEKIGTSDTLSQLNLIDFCIACFEESLIEAREKEKSDKKLYYAVGASAGLVISILMM